MRKILKPFVILALIAAAPASAAAGALVVIASTAPEFKVGAVIQGHNTVNISQGAVVTFVSSDGRTLKVTGPYSGVIDPSAGAANPQLLAALSDIVSRTGKDTSTAGIMRAGFHDADDPWVINSDRSGTYCVRRDRPVRLWRSMAVGRVSASLGTPSLGSAPVRWEDGNNQAPWPGVLPLRDGETYQIQLPRTRRTTRLTLHVVPTNLRSDASRMVWMHRHGCMGQARALLSRLTG